MRNYYFLLKKLFPEYDLVTSFLRASVDFENKEIGMGTLSKNDSLSFLLSLRQDIIQAFETLEPIQKFQKTPWNHPTGGGGEMAVIRGDVFEKAAVNFSHVWGPTFPGVDGKGPFEAMGVSLITHMKNPHAPTVHMNVRYIETEEKTWVAGGYDLSPMGFPYEDDTTHFHCVAKESLDPFGPHLYPLFSQQAKEYFFIPHRKKERGVGGIFFDHYHTSNWEEDFLLWQAVGKSFLLAILPIYQKRLSLPYTEEEKKRQMEMRAHYAEFNFLYDRGTQFGFRSGGNPDAILCSMPPVATW